MKRLEAEIRRRAALGEETVFWWRDDDATAPTPALESLLSLSSRAGVPLALAVIPQPAEPALFERLPATVSVLQHGADHRNRAAAGEKKTEFPASETDAEALARLRAGRERLAALGGAKALAVLAPPWNRLRQSIADKLPEAGLHGLSRYGAVKEAVPGVTQVNTHVDVVAWKAGRGFIGEDAAVALAVSYLNNGTTPIGWLTHHAVHQPGVFNFLERLFESTGRAGARWAGASELFSPSKR